ncbi:hypothetical protein BKA62DRAFT_679308 [Auriculariales sp. MPI-PUGE-AT-0066]|nr:hypothetical protein BKA62DRAFT_679308 [Auriculariales sp. MPI-PUGE-AT-0066]
MGDEGQPKAERASLQLLLLLQGSVSCRLRERYPAADEAPAHYLLRTATNNRMDPIPAQNSRDLSPLILTASTSNIELLDEMSIQWTCLKWLSISTEPIVIGTLSAHFGNSEILGIKEHVAISYY